MIKRPASSLLVSSALPPSPPSLPSTFCFPQQTPLSSVVVAVFEAAQSLSFDAGSLFWQHEFFERLAPPQHSFDAPSPPSQTSSMSGQEPQHATSAHDVDSAGEGIVPVDPPPTHAPF
mmetsp:Transcript_82141/g.160283  ORF Transcript_82141/g.160283 Transcript_82141/m.160283 type:complete len:118 (-) Transcript_82141:124-477(-)